MTSTLLFIRHAETNLAGRFCGHADPPLNERGFAQIVAAPFSDAGAWLAFAVSAAILATVIARYRKDRPLFWAAGMFALALLPVSNLVLLIGATMAERFLYLAHFARCIV